MHNHSCFYKARYYALVRSVRPHTLMHTNFIPLRPLRCHYLTPHVAEQVVLSSSKVLFGSCSRCRWCAFAHRASMAPSTEFFLLLRDCRGSMSSDGTSVAPAAKVIIVLDRLRCLNWLRLRRCRGGRWCRVRLCPCVIIAPWVAVSSRD